MLDTWQDFTFLGLVSAALVLATFALDWRVRAGCVTLLGAWVASQLLSALAIFPWIASEIAINIVVFYVFLQLHFRREGEEREPLWPLFVMFMEFLIFSSHIGYWFFGLVYYATTVNVLFGAELLCLIFIGIWRVKSRFFFSPQRDG